MQSRAWTSFLIISVCMFALPQALAADRPAHGIIDTLLPPKVEQKPQVPRIPSGRLLRFRLESDPTTLDWTMGGVPRAIIQNTMRGLFRISAKTLQPELDLAEDFEWRDSGKRLRIKLREDTRWSDGTLLTAAHATEALRRLFNKKTASPYGYFLNDIAGAETLNPSELQIRTLNHMELEIQFKNPVPYFLAILSHPVTFPIRPDLIAKDPKYGQDPKKMAFLGPYQIDQWTRGIRLLLSLNKKRNLSRSPYIERLEAWIVPDEDAALRLFLGGHLEILAEPQAKKLQNSELEFVKEVETSTLVSVGIHPSHLLTQSPQGILALSHALDRKLLPHFGNTRHRPTSGYVAPPEVFGPWGSLTESESQTPSPPLADQFTRFPITLGFPDQPASRALADWLQSQWKQKLGLTVILKSYDPTNYRREINRSPIPLFVDTQNADYWDPDLFFSRYLSTNPQNLARWKNPEYDRLTLEAAKTSDGKKRAALYQKAQSILLQEQPGTIPLYFSTRQILVQAYVLDLFVDPTGGMDLSTVRYNDQPETNRWR